MNPRVKSVTPNNDYTLTITFTNGEVKLFDVSPYLDKGFFRGLREKDQFYSVRAVLGSVLWQSGQDFCPDTLYEDGTTLPKEQIEITTV